MGGEGDNRDEMVGWITDSVDMSLSKLQELANIGFYLFGCSES